MKFVFWQNVVSIHQSAFIKALAANNDVTLVAEKSIDDQRRREKWIVPSMGDATVVVAPSDEEIFTLLERADTHHVFSGINAYPMVYKAFKKAVKLNLQVSVMAEPYEWAGMKGKLRRLMYRWLFLRFGKHINHLFATGNMGVDCYCKAGFPSEKIHQWGYFTEQPQLSGTDNEPREFMAASQGVAPVLTNVKLLYVGRIDANKNIINLLKRFDEYGQNVERFTIVGDGPLMNELETLASLNPKIKLLGRLGNEEACRVMARNDYLILPSLYDGWGAVVNEAMSVGTSVLCSETCGASILLDGEIRGESFTQANMTEVIKKHCNNGPLSQWRRKAIKNWALENISGTVAADYFTKIIAGNAVRAPWI